MNLSQALKQKNRLAGEYVRLAAILSRENSRRNDNPSKIDVQVVYTQMVETSNQLGELKAKIAAANVPIYPLIGQLWHTPILIFFASTKLMRDLLL